MKPLGESQRASGSTRPFSSMNNEDEPRHRRSSFQLLADAVGATDARVAPDDADARRRRDVPGATSFSNSEAV